MAQKSNPVFGGKVMLNIGSGPRPIRGAVNLDIVESGGHHRWKQKPPEVYADAHKLPFRDKVFHGCAMLHVLEHLREPYRAMLDVHRVLRDDGILVVEIPDPQKVPTERREHVYSWTKWSLRSFLEICGFQKYRRPDIYNPFKMSPAFSKNQRVVAHKI